MNANNTEYPPVRSTQTVVMHFNIAGNKQFKTNTLSFLGIRKKLSFRKPNYTNKQKETSVVCCWQQLTRKTIWGWCCCICTGYKSRNGWTSSGENWQGIKRILDGKRLRWNHFSLLCQRENRPGITKLGYLLQLFSCKWLRLVFTARSHNITSANL